MTFFRGEYHLDRAIDSALALRAKIRDLPPIIDKVTYEPVVSIGINCGELVSGNIRSVNLKRLDCTVIGDVVNIASRLETAAEPGRIVINENAYQKIKEYFKCKKLGEISMKNKSGPMMVYEVVE